MPAAPPTRPTVLLPYLHYSRPVPSRPAVRGADRPRLDGARLQSLAATDNWQLDPRLAAELQAGPPVYAHNDLDRGHLVMRASSTWGDTEEEARQAEADTFYFTNAAPQAAMFNQGRELWLGLEEYLQEHAATFDRKLAVFAGPVLDPDDPPYRGIQIPLRFWKVVAFVQDGALAATGYILDQTPLVDDLDAALAEAAAAAGAVPRWARSARSRCRSPTSPCWPAWTSTSWSSSTGSARRRRRGAAPTRPAGRDWVELRPWTTSGSDGSTLVRQVATCLWCAPWATCSRPSRTRPGAPSSTNSRSGTARRCSSCAPG